MPKFGKKVGSSSSSNRRSGGVYKRPSSSSSTSKKKGMSRTPSRSKSSGKKGVIVRAAPTSKSISQMAKTNLTSFRKKTSLQISSRFQSTKKGFVMKAGQTALPSQRIKPKKQVKFGDKGYFSSKLNQTIKSVQNPAFRLQMLRKKQKDTKSLILKATPPTVAAHILNKAGIVEKIQGAFKFPSFKGLPTIALPKLPAFNLPKIPKLELPKIPNPFSMVGQAGVEVVGGVAKVVGAVKNTFNQKVADTQQSISGLVENVVGVASDWEAKRKREKLIRYLILGAIAVFIGALMWKRK